MKVKVVQLSEPHVMGILSFPTPERTPKTTSNDVKARGLEEKYVASYLARSRFISPSLLLKKLRRTCTQSRTPPGYYTVDDERGGVGKRVNRQKVYSRTRAIGEVAAARDARKHENLRLSLCFLKPLVSDKKFST